MATADRLAAVASRIAATGVPVEYYPGWRTRGRGHYTPRGHVEHCTSDAQPLSRGRMLQLLAEGHGNLRNALCTWAVPRERPAAVLIAARVAWHAGSGGWEGLTGNSSVSGTEIQRATGQAITSAQLDVARAIARHMAAEFGFDSGRFRRVCTHNEWTPRKVDPHGVDGAVWRAELVTLPDDPEPEEDDVKIIHIGELGMSFIGAPGRAAVHIRNSSELRQWREDWAPEAIEIRWQTRAALEHYFPGTKIPG